MGDPAEVEHKIQVRRRHCETFGRNPNEIVVTAMFRNLPPAPTVDDVVSSAEAFAAIQRRRSRFRSNRRIPRVATNGSISA